MGAPEDSVAVVFADAADVPDVPDAAGAAQASVGRLLGEINVMQRSASIDNEHFATAIRTCQAVLDTTIADIQLATVADIQLAAQDT